MEPYSILSRKTVQSSLMRFLVGQSLPLSSQLRHHGTCEGEYGGRDGSSDPRVLQTCNVQWMDRGKIFFRRGKGQNVLRDWTLASAVGHIGLIPSVSLV